VSLHAALAPAAATAIRVALLTGPDDRSYALGLTSSLVARGICVDFIGSDQIDGPELHGTPLVEFLNLRGDQSHGASLASKVVRLLRYYLRLMVYAVRAEPRIFHILWNNKFEAFDRTLLMIYYRLFGRSVVLTAHNVNAAKRDGRDNAWNRVTLRVQYRLCSHIFVHTPRMQAELCEEFGVDADRISAIPFGINNTTPTTQLSGAQARERLGVRADARVMLFFGQIAPYKGLEHLVAALPQLMHDSRDLHLVVAGKVKTGHESYWEDIERSLSSPSLEGRVTTRIAHIPDNEVEVFFKAADVLVVPYVHIFQSGVPFLAYSFGLPVIATDVGSLKDDIVAGKTGAVCRPADPDDLARAIEEYFESDLFLCLGTERVKIQEFANQRYSWAKVADITELVYRRVLAKR
jgi:D-inositol-3-phosphate glycosyltransferase